MTGVRKVRWQMRNKAESGKEREVKEEEVN